MNISEMRRMETNELVAARKQLERDLWSVRFQFHTGAEASSSKVRDAKKLVARINTVIRERELGIDPGPKKGN